MLTLAAEQLRTIFGGKMITNGIVVGKEYQFYPAAIFDDWKYILYDIDLRDDFIKETGYEKPIEASGDIVIVSAFDSAASFMSIGYLKKHPTYKLLLIAASLEEISILNKKAEVVPTCCCDVFITGCICGVFQKEQAAQ